MDSAAVADDEQAKATGSGGDGSQGDSRPPEGVATREIAETKDHIPRRRDDHEKSTASESIAVTNGTADCSIAMDTTPICRDARGSEGQDEEDCSSQGSGPPPYNDTFAAPRELRREADGDRSTMEPLLKTPKRHTSRTDRPFKTRFTKSLDEKVREEDEAEGEGGLRDDDAPDAAWRGSGPGPPPPQSTHGALQTWKRAPFRRSVTIREPVSDDEFDSDRATHDSRSRDSVFHSTSPDAGSVSSSGEHPSNGGPPPAAPARNPELTIRKLCSLGGLRAAPGSRPPSDGDHTSVTAMVPVEDPPPPPPPPPPPARPRRRTQARRYASVLASIIRACFPRLCPCGRDRNHSGSRDEEDIYLLEDDPLRKRCMRAFLTFLYIILVLVGVVFTYSMIQDLVTAMKNPVRSIHYHKVQEYAAPGIAVYPGGAKFLACHHYHNNVVKSKVSLTELDLTHRNCSFTELHYEDPHYPGIGREALVVRGPTSFKSREAVFLHFSLEDPTRDFFTVSYFVFPGFDEFNSSATRIDQLIDFHRYMPTFALSAELRMWIKLILSETYLMDDTKHTEFKVEYSVVRFMDRRPKNETKTHLFFIFFEWKNDIIEQSYLLYTTTPWSLGAGLCGVFLTLHRVYQLGHTSYQRVQKDKQRRSMRKRTLRELRRQRSQLSEDAT